MTTVAMTCPDPAAQWFLLGAGVALTVLGACLVLIGIDALTKARARLETARAMARASGAAGTYHDPRYPELHP